MYTHEWVWQNRRSQILGQNLCSQWYPFNRNFTIQALVNPMYTSMKLKDEVGMEGSKIHKQDL